MTLGLIAMARKGGARRSNAGKDEWRVEKAGLICRVERGDQRNSL
jgi:hypothetical protein